MRRNLSWIPTALVMVIQSSVSQNGWTVHSSGIKNIYCVKAVDRNIAWAAGDSGTVAITTDGGTSWTLAGTGTLGKAVVFNIDALSANTALITATPSSTTYIYRTTNRGATWSPVFSQVEGFIDDIRMTDATNGFAVGDPVGGKWTVLRTTDGGATWARLPGEPAQYGGERGMIHNSLSVTGTSDIRFSTDGNRIYRSTDGGGSWSFSTLPIPHGLSVWFNSVNLGLVSYNRTTGARSTDAGLTWDIMSFAGTGVPYCLAGAGVTDFWAANCGIYRSTDAGVSWSLELSGPQWIALDFITIGTSAIGYAASPGGAIARYSGTITIFRQTDGRTPAGFNLGQNHPNPFNPGTSIRVCLPQTEHVTLAVYNSAGEKVETLISQSLQAGTYSVDWNAQQYASGIYLYRLAAGTHAEVKKMVLLR